MDKQTFLDGSYDPKTNTITLYDPVIGSRTFIATDLNVIKDQLRLLTAYKNDGRVPKQELLDDIAAYKAIVEAPDAAIRAEDYFKVKAFDGSLRPREVARLKGWIK